MTREDWINSFIAEFRPVFDSAGFPLPAKIRGTCGFPSTKARSLDRVGLTRPRLILTSRYSSRLWCLSRSRWQAFSCMSYAMRPLTGQATKAALYTPLVSFCLRASQRLLS